MQEIKDGCMKWTIVIANKGWQQETKGDNNKWCAGLLHDERW